MSDDAADYKVGVENDFDLLGDDDADADQLVARARQLKEAEKHREAEARAKQQKEEREKLEKAKTAAAAPAAAPATSNAAPAAAAPAGQRRGPRPPRGDQQPVDAQKDGGKRAGELRDRGTVRQQRNRGPKETTEEGADGVRRTRHREFERHSGTGHSIAGEQKRHGFGKGNAGTARDELRGRSDAKTELAQEVVDSGAEAPATPADSAAAPAATAAAAATDAPKTPEEPVTRSLADFLAAKSAGQVKVAVDSRVANDGQNDAVEVLQRKERQAGSGSSAASAPRRKQREQQAVAIAVNFNEARSSRPPRRDGPPPSGDRPRGPPRRDGPPSSDRPRGPPRQQAPPQQHQPQQQQQQHHQSSEKVDLMSEAAFPSLHA